MAPRKQSRAAKRAGKKGPVLKNENTEELEDFQEPGDLEELTSQNIPQGSDVLLYQYLQRNELIDNEYYVTLYKYDREHGEMKTYCERWTGQIPNEDYIGKNFGGGRYVLILQVTDVNGKNKGTTKKIRLHKRYDALASRAKNQESNNFPMINLGGGGENGGNTLQDAIGLIQVMMGTFMPLLKMMQLPAQQAPPQSVSEPMADMMKENYRGMNEIMKEMFLDNTQMFNDLSRKAVDLPEVTEDENETSGVVGMINSILPVIEHLLPLITTRGSQGMKAVETIKSMPQYAKIVQDKKTIKRLVDFISQKHGPEIAKQVLQKFKIKNPYSKKTGRSPAKKEEEPAKK
jgi:hypothetical protein